MTCVTFSNIWVNSARHNHMNAQIHFVDWWVKMENHNGTTINLDNGFWLQFELETLFILRQTWWKTHYHQAKHKNIDEDAPDNNNNENQRKIELENGKPIQNNLLTNAQTFNIKEQFCYWFFKVFHFDHHFF